MRKVLLAAMFLVVHATASQAAVSGTAFIDSLKVFVNYGLQMQVPANFYSEWEEGKDSMYTFLYASHRDSSINSGFCSYYEQYDSALQRKKQLENMGYHTLLYRTAGTSKAALNSKLLSYEPEAIAFIFFHEFAHRVIRNTTYTFNYNYEEALCDVFAGRCCLQFARTTGLMDTNSVKKQQRCFEDVYRYTNGLRVALDSSTANDRLAVFITAADFIRTVTATANTFVKERLQPVVNNAFFLRLRPYALNYFEVQRMFDYETDLNNIIDKITPLRHHVAGTYFGRPGMPGENEQYLYLNPSPVFAPGVNTTAPATPGPK